MSKFMFANSSDYDILSSSRNQLYSNWFFFLLNCLTHTHAHTHEHTQNIECVEHDLDIEDGDNIPARRSTLTRPMKYLYFGVYIRNDRTRVVDRVYAHMQLCERIVCVCADNDRIWAVCVFYGCASMDAPRTYSVGITRFSVAEWSTVYRLDTSNAMKQVCFWKPHYR